MFTVLCIIYQIIRLLWYDLKRYLDLIIDLFMRLHIALHSLISCFNWCSVTFFFRSHVCLCSSNYNFYRLSCIVVLKHCQILVNGDMPLKWLSSFHFVFNLILNGNWNTMFECRIRDWWIFSDCYRLIVPVSRDIYIWSSLIYLVCISVVELVNTLEIVL